MRLRRLPPTGKIPDRVMAAFLALVVMSPVLFVGAMAFAGIDAAMELFVAYCEEWEDL